MKLMLCLFVLYIAKDRVDGQFYYGLADAVPSASQLQRQNQQHRTPQPVQTLPQYQPNQHYSQYVQQPRYIPQGTYHTSSETVVAPVQHSTVIHHTPYRTITGQSPPFLGRYVLVDGKQPHVHVQPVQQQKQRPQHPLQHPLHYQQQQKFNPSPEHPQSKGNNQEQFVPIRRPIQHQQEQQTNQNRNPEVEEDEDEKSEDIQEENEEVEEDEEKGNLNEEAEENEDSEDQPEQYQNEEETEEDEEDHPKYRHHSYQVNTPKNKKQHTKNHHRHQEEDDDEEDHPKYITYSFQSNSPENKKQKKKLHRHQEEEDEEEQEGYRTHEDVEEDDEEDSNEDSSKINYSKSVKNKKTPKNYTKFAKFEFRPPYTKYLYPPYPKPSEYKDIKPTKPKQVKKDTQAKSSKNVPVTTTYREKWYIMKKTTK